MPRVSQRKADAIFTADLHLRDDQPECRTDDFRGAQQEKVRWLADLQRQHGCPVVDAGDVFNKWQVSSELEGFALLNLPADLITIPGNHDLPQHSLKLYQKSSLHVLEAAGKVKVLKEPTLHIEGGIGIIGFPYGSTFSEISPLMEKNIAVVHAYVAEQVPVFIADGWTPAQLFAALPGYDVIVSGHNHMPLVYEHRGRLVVNPGSMMRSTADQADHRPRAYLWYADTNTVEPAYYPIRDGVVSREHIDAVDRRDERMRAFVDSLDTGVELGLSFETNMERFLAANDVRKPVADVVWECMGGKDGK